MATQKAIGLQRALVDALKVRLSSLVLTESFDATSGDPTILIGAAAPNAQGCFIRIKAEASIQKDILGLAQNVWTPHVIQVAWEANAGGTAPDPAFNTMATILAVYAEVLGKGAKTEIYLEDDGTAPSITTFSAAAKMKASFDSLYWPLMSTS
jgi:hypothetical protein